MSLYLDEIQFKIADLAIRGRLTLQNENDVSAIELSKVIQIKKENKKKKEFLPPKRDIQAPFELPRNWAWTTLSIIGETSPRNQADDNLDASFISMSMIPTKHGQQALCEKRKWKDIKGEFTHFANNDVALAKMTSCFQNGKAFIAKNLLNGIGAGTTELYIFRGNPRVVLPEYVLLFLKSSYFREEALNKSSGTAQQRIPKDYFNSCPFPLPPIAEQMQIIQKAAELFNVVEELSLLTTDITATVSDIKNKALQLAIQGKLTKQNLADEPTNILLEKIQQEKETLIREGKIKKNEPLPPITEEEEPFKLPRGWEWCRIGQIALTTISGGTPSKYNPAYWGGNIPWASVKDMNNETFIKSTIDTITEEGLLNSRANLIPKENIIICTRMGLGKININSIDVAINQDLKAVLLPKSVDKYYFYYYYQTLDINGVGMTVKGIQVKKIINMLMPLPPLAEQKRIVEKINQIIALCDEIESSIK